MVGADRKESGFDKERYKRKNTCNSNSGHQFGAAMGGLRGKGKKPEYPERKIPTWGEEIEAGLPPPAKNDRRVFEKKRKGNWPF